MKTSLLALSMFILFQTSILAADKIRIGYPDFNSSTFTLPLAQIRGFFREEGLQAELIRIRSAVAIPALTSGRRNGSFRNNLNLQVTCRDRIK